MDIPSINSTLLLYDYIKKLALPLEVYAAVKNLNKVTKFDCKYAAPSKKRRKAVTMPEAQLMSLVVVVVKLLFPFDSDVVKRYPYSLNEAAAQRIDWAAWLGTRTKVNCMDPGETPLGIRKEIETKDEDIFQMSEAQLDMYMDWYQKTWSQSGAEEKVNREILDQFPLKQLPLEPVRGSAEAGSDNQDKLVRVVHASTKLRRPISADEAEQRHTPVLRPGMQYMRYHSIENLSGTAKAFHEAAAMVACLSMKNLVLAINQTERKIEIWRQAKRRAEHFGEKMDLEAEGRLASSVEEVESLHIVAGETFQEDEKAEEDEDIDMQTTE